MPGKKKMSKKSTANILGDDIGKKVDFWIHTFEAKRRRTEDKPEKFLQHIEGHVEPGTVCAVIGPQNSGKQKLLALLAGRVAKHICLGQVMVNNSEHSAALMRATSSYLSGAGQNLVSQMTVEEAVDYTARLVLPKNVDEIARRERVHSILKEVGLGGIIERKIGGGGQFGPISSEERVRVNLAQVLMENKKIIFLDEPTQGLDLLASEKVLKSLVSLAEERLLTIFISIEHPTKVLLELFHKCLFLAKGRQVYFGRVRHTVDFFSRLGHPIPEETSIYDHVLSLTVPEHSIGDGIKGGLSGEAQDKHLDKLLERANVIFDEIEMSKLHAKQRKERATNLEKYKRNNTYITADTSGMSNFNISWRRQVGVLFSRYMLSFRRDFGSFVWRFILALIWALIYFCCCADAALGRIYPFDVTDLITALTLSAAGIQALSLTGLPQAEAHARTYQQDMEQNLYRPSAFIFAHLFISSVGEFVLVIPIVICYFFTLGFSKDGMEDNFDGPPWILILFWFSIILLFVAVISELFILSIALLFKKHSTMYLVSGFIHFLCVLLSGGVIRICTQNLNQGVSDVVTAVSWLSPTKLAVDGLMLLSVRDIVYTDEPTNIPGNDIMNNELCFDTWMHADQVSWVMLIMGIMLGALLIFFFGAARMRAAEAGTK